MCRLFPTWSRLAPTHHFDNSAGIAPLGRHDGRWRRPRKEGRTHTTDLRPIEQIRPRTGIFARFSDGRNLFANPIRPVHTRPNRKQPNMIHNRPASRSHQRRRLRSARSSARRARPGRARLRPSRAGLRDRISPGGRGSVRAALASVTESPLGGRGSVRAALASVTASPPGGRGSVRAGIGTRLARRLALPECLKGSPGGRGSVRAPLAADRATETARPSITLATSLFRPVRPRHQHRAKTHNRPWHEPRLHSCAAAKSSIQTFFSTMLRAAVHLPSGEGSLRVVSPIFVAPRDRRKPNFAVGTPE